MNLPVLGKLGPMFGTSDFRGFNTGHVHGLARDRFSELHILAIRAEHEGAGDVGRFLDRCQEAFPAIIVFEVASPRLRGMLERRGFTDAVVVEANGDVCDVMRWKR